MKMDEQRMRHLLLVDDEPNILSALKRLLRRDGYKIVTAESGAEALEILKTQEFGVIVSDQRMPQMTGSEFLSQVKELYPHTLRIMLSGYTDLDSVTEAINKGAIYRFLTKPWQDDLLRENIQKAFNTHELSEENRRLSDELSEINEVLESRVEEKTRELRRNMVLLELSREVLQNMPVAVLVFDPTGMIVVANREAHELCKSSSLIGQSVNQALPADLAEKLALDLSTDEFIDERIAAENGTEYLIHYEMIVAANGVKGSALTIQSIRNGLCQDRSRMEAGD